MSTDTISDTRFLAGLVGTQHHPLIKLRFPNGAHHPVSGEELTAWLRQFPDARWSTMDRAWYLSSCGRDPGEELLAAGFKHYIVRIDGVDSIDDLATPLVAIADDRMALVEDSDDPLCAVWLRFGTKSDYDPLLNSHGTWVQNERRWIIPLSGFAAMDSDPFVIDDAVKKLVGASNKPKQRQNSQPEFEIIKKTVQKKPVAKQKSYQLTRDDLPSDLVIPDWFGLALDDYQVTGALHVANGRTLLCDTMGLGKTRTAIAAAATLGSKRTIVVSPPVMLTDWYREMVAAGLPWLGPTPDGVDMLSDRSDNSADNVLIIRPTMKSYALPDQGVVIVADTLLAARREMRREIEEWQADVLIVDEAHRQKTWMAKRSRAVRELAASIQGLRVVITGTPLFANPVEMASPLAIAGHLDATFGGYGRFTSTYARKNHFKQWVPRKKKLPQLKRVLDEKVWVRRLKEDVLASLPPKTRQVKYIEIDRKSYNAAHRDVIKTIKTWLSSLDDRPTPSEIEDWCSENIGCISQLRRAAGMAKVDIAAEMITEWVEASTEVDDGGNPTYSRPLVVWTHHRDVSEAMAQTVPEKVGTARSIIGGTPLLERSEIVDDFQAGKIPVIVCSIHAAGVGITLTRSTDALFVETDWTPALVAQAEDRIHRRGTVSPVMITTLVAVDTLDERIQQTLQRKAKILDAVLGGNNNVSAANADDLSKSTPAEILRDLVHEALTKS